MAIDWANLEKEMNKGGNFAPEGVYETTVKSVSVVKSTSKGTPGLQFIYNDTAEYTLPQKYPMAHYCLGDNDNFRRYHCRNLMMVLGQSKENAQKAVEVIEGKDDFVAEYEDAFKRLIEKKPKVKVAVYYLKEGDKNPYGLDFADESVRMGRTRKEETSGKSTDEMNDIISEAETVEADDIPF